MSVRESAPQEMTKMENIHMRLPLNLETLGALLAQPGYDKEEARLRLLEQPQEVVRTLLHGLGDTVAEQTGKAVFRQLGSLGEDTQLEVHENSATTWNIIIPSREMLDMEAQSSLSASSEPLSDELLEKISAGEILTVTITSVLTSGLTSLTFSALVPIIIASASVAVGTAVLGAAAATAIAVTAN